LKKNRSGRAEVKRAETSAANACLDPVSLERAIRHDVAAFSLRLRASYSARVTSRISTNTGTVIIKPAREQQVEFTPGAVAAIITETHGYPYFLQEWGKHSWDIAESSPITERDVLAASTQAIAALDESFFRVRFDRLTPTEKTYLRAMAELGPGPHRSGDIAEELSRPSSSLGPVRSSLIVKGMIWSPTFGDTAFTVPLFDKFMKRIIPRWSKPAPKG
jgi:hypothetical protein